MTAFDPLRTLLPEGRHLQRLLADARPSASPLGNSGFA